MNIDTGFTTSAPPPEPPLRQRILRRPSTRLGWWSVGLGAMVVFLFIINAIVFVPVAAGMDTMEAPWRQTLLPFFGIAVLLVGLAAGIVGLVAVIRKRERSWLVWLTFLPGLFILFLLLGEVLVPH